MSASPLPELARIVGAAHLLLPGAEDLAPYTVDWRKRYSGRALAVVRPADAAQVAEVVRACAAAGAAIVPQGGNTGLVGGSVPDDSGTQVVLSTKRLNRVREVDAANATLTVEAGCTLAEVQAAAERAGLLFPLSLGSEGSCTIGGNLSTNAGGTQVLRYGNARELCLGLEVVTPQGEIWNGLQGLRKDNTGYDLRDLYIGSEGTLGIVTAATLKLFPKPRTLLTAWAALDTLEAACALLQAARAALDAGLTGFEAMNAFSLQLVARHFPQIPQPLPSAPWSVLLELSDTGGEDEAHARLEALLARAMDDGRVRDAVVAQSLTQARAMWHLRECIPLAQAEEGLNIKHDIGLPASRIAAFVEQADAALQAALPGTRFVNFGHLGDGNLHYNLQAPEGVDAAAFLAQHEAAVNAIVYDAVSAHGGTISAEHGIGQLKRDELKRRKSPVALGLMRSLKYALDPQGLLNPGRVT
ncbi:MAG: FAD-binding oxidoreductase [Aquabacterium sp.]|nr:MAG: FAD-binding oxidoreductase [Aquabacterium sp.]